MIPFAWFQRPTSERYPSCGSSWCLSIVLAWLARRQNGITSAENTSIDNDVHQAVTLYVRKAFCFGVEGCENLHRGSFVGVPTHYTTLTRPVYTYSE